MAHSYHCFILIWKISLDSWTQWQQPVCFDVFLQNFSDLETLELNIFMTIHIFHPSISCSLNTTPNLTYQLPNDTTCWKRSSILPRPCSIIIHCEKNTSISSVGRKPQQPGISPLNCFFQVANLTRWFFGIFLSSVWTVSIFLSLPWCLDSS